MNPPTEAAAATPGELKSGTTLDGRFEIIRLLNRGGMACVYLATDRENARTVAIKVPLLKYESDPVTYTRFQREEEIGRRLSHPYILKVLPTGRPKSRPYLVMEYLEGEPLNRRIKAQGQLPEAEAARITAQVCQALECLRTNGIVHRDLKPENIMLCRDGTVRLLDFGIARATDSRRLTLTGLTTNLGTPDYMAPEQVGGKRGDHRTDIYSLGAILYEMVTGRVPFEGDSPYVIMNARTGGDPVAPRIINPQLSPAIEEIILHAMARDPAERQSTAAELQGQLEDYGKVRLTERHLRLQPVGQGMAQEPPWIMRGVVIALAVVIVQLGLFGLLFWHFARSGHR